MVQERNQFLPQFSRRSLPYPLDHLRHAFPTNAHHMRNVPGRKSDRNDAAWIADLLAHGRIRGSFVPPAPIQELRDLTRTHKQLVREVARHTGSPTCWRTGGFEAASCRRPRSRNCAT